MARGWEKWVAFGDNHGNLVCRNSRDALLKFIKHWKPKHRIHVGDCFDFAALRRGVGVEDSEAYDDLESDLVAGFLFWEATKPTALLLGNHDARLWNVAKSSASQLKRIAANDLIKRIEKQARRTKTKLLPYHYDKGVYRLAQGRLAFVHGYTANMNSVSQQATHFGEGKGGGVVMGHLHRVEMQNGKRHAGTRGWSIGCMADFSQMAYCSHRLATAQWQNAFAFGVVKGNQFITWVATRTGDKWILPTGVEEF